MNYCMALKPGLVSHTEKAAIVSLCIQIIARILFHYLFKMNEVSLTIRYSIRKRVSSPESSKKAANIFSIEPIFIGTKSEIHENSETIRRFTVNFHDYSHGFVYFYIANRTGSREIHVYFVG